jgi:hypothetical protein
VYGLLFRWFYSFLLFSQVKFITSDTQIGGRQIPAPLDLPDGVLFFGLKTKKAEHKDGVEEKKPFDGKGNTLRTTGRK